MAENDTRQSPLVTATLEAMRDWIAKVSDEDDDCGYLNGDSDKYPGDAWEDLEKIDVQIRTILKSGVSQS